MKYNIPMLKEDLKLLATEITQAKREIRQPNKHISAVAAQYITDLREQFSILCILRADNRGEAHITRQFNPHYRGHDADTGQLRDSAEPRTRPVTKEQINFFLAGHAELVKKYAPTAEQIAKAQKFGEQQVA